MKIHVLYILMLFSVSRSKLIDSHELFLIDSFLKYKSVLSIIIFYCSSKKDNLNMVKYLMNQNVQFWTCMKNGIDFCFQLQFRKFHHIGVIVQGDCGDVENVLLQCHGRTVFYETYHWLVLTKNKENVFRYMSRIETNINADVTVADLKELSNISLYDVYNPAFKNGGVFRMQSIGYCNENEGYVVKYRGNKYWSRKNMSEVHFKSAVVVPHLTMELKEYLASDENRKINSQHRFQAVTVSHCRDMYNFTLHMQRTDSWGYRQKNGHFDGMVGLLERKEIDFGSSPLLYKLDRMPVVGYSYGNWILKSAFIYRRPKSAASSYTIFLRPFHIKVWYCTIISFFMILMFLRLTFDTEHFVFKEFRDLIERTWSNMTLYVVACLCQQGYDLRSRLISGKIVALSSLLLSLLVYQFYSASIVSYLLMDPPRTINNLEDLRDSTLNVGVEDILIDRAYFAETNYEAAIDLYNKKIRNSNNNSGFYEPEDGLRLVRNGGFAFHVETSTAYPIIEETFTNELICELEEVQMYRTQPMHTNLQKHSPFIEMMNYCMHRLVEDGEMSRLRKHWDARKPECVQSAKRTLKAVGLEEFSFAFEVLAMGVFISLVILAIEKILAQQDLDSVVVIRRLRRKNWVAPGEQKGNKDVKMRNVDGVIIPFVN